MRHTSLAVLLGLALSGCAPVLLEKGSIARVEAARHAQKPSLECSARWDPSSGLVLQVMKRTEVVLLRAARFNTLEWRGQWLWWAEPLELLTSPVMLLVQGGLVATAVLPPSTADVQVPLGSRLLMATASLNPAVTLLGTRLERTRTLGEELFVDPRSELRYTVQLPVRGLPLRYQALAADGSPLASGEARTDDLGQARVLKLPAPPASVRVLLPEGERRVVP